MPRCSLVTKAAFGICLMWVWYGFPFDKVVQLGVSGVGMSLGLSSWDQSNRGTVPWWAQRHRLPLWLHEDGGVDAWTTCDALLCSYRHGQNRSALHLCVLRCDDGDLARCDVLSSSIASAQGQLEHDVGTTSAICIKLSLIHI